MFRIYKVKAAAGYEVVVDGSIVERIPVRVCKEEQVYVVSFAPLVVEEKTVSQCREGIPYEIIFNVKLSFQQEDLTEILRGAGYSTYHNPIRITVEEFVERHNLLHQLRASVQSYVQASGFFELADQDATRKELHKGISSRCHATGLAAEVVSCNVLPVMPESPLLAQLAAKALTQPSFKLIVEYFQETMRRTVFLEAEREEAKVQAQQQIIKARTDLKVFEIEENDRIAGSEQQSKAKAEERQTADQERNARLKTHNAELEFQYKDKRLEEDKVIAEKEVEVARVRELSEEARRESKHKDMVLELEREQNISQIRQEEIVTTLQGLKEIPLPDYSGLSTLITDGSEGRGEHHDVATGLVLALVGRLSESLGILGKKKTQMNREIGSNDIGSRSDQQIVS